MSEWVSVKDKLPAEFEDVLTCNMNGNCLDEKAPIIGYFQLGLWFWVDRTDFDHFENIYPTHWMPMPVLPKMEE